MVSKSIQDKLNSALSPVRLEIINESAAHQGHAGDNGSGQTHFKVMVVSAAFAGMNRVARQRLIYQVLADELAGPVHALSLQLQTPDEANG